MYLPCGARKFDAKGNPGTKIEKLAKIGHFFYMDWHVGKNGSNAATTIICLGCMAGITINHEGLPPKNPNKLPQKLIDKVDKKIVEFLWTEEYIEKHGLLPTVGRGVQDESSEDGDSDGGDSV